MTRDFSYIDTNLERFVTDTYDLEIARANASGGDAEAIRYEKQAVLTKMRLADTERQTRENALEHVKQFSAYMSVLERALHDIVSNAEYLPDNVLQNDLIQGLIEHARAALVSEKPE